MRELLTRVAHRTMQWNFRLWGFGEAIALRGLVRAGEVLDDPVPEAFVHGLLRAWLGKGVARPPEDHVAPGRELLRFYASTGDALFLNTACKLADLHASFPAHDSGAHFHRPDQPGWRSQIWVDCMDAEPPFLVRLGAVTGRERYFDQGASEILAYARLLQDENTGLMRHGFEAYAGRNGEHWARGNGWALMGLVEVLNVLPRAHGTWAELHQRLQMLSSALERAQHPEGLWHTVLDDENSYLESTLAAMACMAWQEAVEAGLLQPNDAQRKAREALKPLIEEDGSLLLVSEATPVGPHATYTTRPFGVYPWGQGPLLLALAQEIDPS